MVHFIFWFSLALLAYTYVGYPVAVALWARVFPRPHTVAVNEQRGRGIDVTIRPGHATSNLEVPRSGRANACMPSCTAPAL